MKEIMPTLLDPARNRRFLAFLPVAKQCILSLTVVVDPLKTTAFSDGIHASVRMGQDA